MFMKDKRDRIIKGRKCSDRRKKGRVYKIIRITPNRGTGVHADHLYHGCT